MSAPKTGEIGFEHKGIGTVLATYRLAVPLNQREYSWVDEHVTDLFQDFTNAIAQPGVHFLGTIVLTSGEGDIPEVSDGQQRLATTTILLAAIRDYFARSGDHPRAAEIEVKFLRETDMDTTCVVPKLTLNVDDNEYFTKSIVSSPGTPERKIEPNADSHVRIQRAATLARQHVEQIVQLNKANAPVRLVEWVKFIRNSALVVVLKVPDSLNAFEIFETLNGRGLEASQADLLKNDLLKNAGTKKSEAQQKWARMLGSLQSVPEDEITVKYLHHFLITKYGPTKEREVLKKVKTTVNTQSRAIEFLDEVSQAAQDYAALFNPDHSKWNQHGTPVRHSLTTINRDLRVEQIRPLMFAVARKFSPKETRLAFRLFVFWSVRFLLVGGRGGLLDRNYAVCAKDVGSGAIKTARALSKAMEEVIPSDNLFAAAFSEARVSKSYLARYYMRAMEQKLKNQDDAEWVPSDDEQSINLEHILPENPGSLWPTIDPAAAAASYNRIGNFVMLQALRNSIIGNASFAEKKAVFKDSTYELTRSVAKYDKWGTQEITERQAKLAQLAVKTWPATI